MNEGLYVLNTVNVLFFYLKWTYMHLTAMLYLDQGLEVEVLTIPLRNPAYTTGNATRTSYGGCQGPEGKAAEMEDEVHEPYHFPKHSNVSWVQDL